MATSRKPTPPTAEAIDAFCGDHGPATAGARRPGRARRPLAPARDPNL